MSYSPKDVSPIQDSKNPVESGGVFSALAILGARVEGQQLSNIQEGASAEVVGTLRYREEATGSFLEICMKTGSSSYAWVVIIANGW